MSTQLTTFNVNSFLRTAYDVSELKHQLSFEQYADEFHKRLAVIEQEQALAKQASGRCAPPSA